MRTQAAAVGIMILLFAGLFPAPVSCAQEMQNLDSMPEAPIRPGDICIVCGKEVDPASGVATVYRGRRVPAASREMLRLFLQNPTAYFGKLQGRGGLIDENAVVADIRPWWFIFGVWVVVALLSAAVAAPMALRRGLSPGKYFFAGLGGSVLTLLWLKLRTPKADASLPDGLAKLPTTAAPNACPACGTLNHPAAARCTRCATELKPVYESEARRANLD